uniref:Ig-like domain-containing protein n=1 Tax=Gopherus evgoodei TaxID=1825980 RepID=A0A8C4YLZ5_9SAUR
MTVEHIVLTTPVEKVQLPTVAPPKITQQLKVEACGDKIRFSCAAESSILSVREVSWYKDGNKLKEDNHFMFHYSADGTYELKVHNLTESDQGEYTCEITGEGGVSKTNFQFVGQVFKSIHSQVSSLIEKSKSVEKEAEALKFSTQKKSAVTTQEKEKVTVKANIDDASDVKWVLNGMELPNSEDYRYGVSGNDHTLTIKKASHKDEGILTCEGKTDQGIVRCQFDITFSTERSNAPAFITQPKSQNIDEGQDVLLTCEISGDPSPEIEWFKNNQPIAMSSKINVNRSNTIYSLNILNAAVSDSGKYTVKQQNYISGCSCNFPLFIHVIVEAFL